jgi:hypothetical protein
MAIFLKLSNEAVGVVMSISQQVRQIGIKLAANSTVLMDNKRCSFAPHLELLFKECAFYD